MIYTPGVRETAYVKSQTSPLNSSMVEWVTHMACFRKRTAGMMAGYV
jgi:hypothetical protein